MSDWLKKSSKNEGKNFLQKQKFRLVFLAQNHEKRWKIFQAGEAEELDDTNARKILSLFEKRLRKNQELRIKFAKKPEKFMKSEVELHDMIQDIR